MNNKSFQFLLFFLIILLLGQIASASSTIHVDATNNQGTTYVAAEDGVFRFTITGGAYRNAPLPAPGYPDGMGWYSWFYIYVNRPIEWISDIDQWGTHGWVPGNPDHQVGVGGPFSTAAIAEALGNGRYQDVSLKKGQYVILTIHDSRDYYSDNVGGMSVTVTMIPPLSPSFTATPTSGDAPLTVDFTDTSTGAITMWKWDFDNDGIVDSEDQHPTHIFEHPGKYAVKLSVSGEGGTESVIKPDYIDVQSFTVISVSPTAAIEETDNVLVRVFGQGFPENTEFRIINATLGEIPCQPGTLTRISETELTGKFSFIGAKVGSYDVLATGPDGSSDSLVDGFSVDPIPVILVHGWKGTGDVWGPLTARLNENGIDSWVFDYKDWNTADPRVVASRLRDFIKQKRLAYRPDLYGSVPGGYPGKVDIVCHSMGAIVSRWYMEKLGYGDDVRQWIGIAPAHGGSALADKWDEIPWLSSQFAYIIGGPALDQLQTTSESVQGLRSGTLSPHTTYRVIAGWNPSLSGDFGQFGPVSILRMTQAKDPTENGGLYYWTRNGDMIVANQQSYRPDMGFDCYPIKGDARGEPARNFDHLHIPQSPQVMEAVIKYLKNPAEQSTNYLPYEDRWFIEWRSNSKTYSGYIDRWITLGHTLAVAFVNAVPRSQSFQVSEVPGAAERALIVELNWTEGDLSLNLTSPDGLFIAAGSTLSNVWYDKGQNHLSYTVTSPTAGNWTADITPLSLPGNPIGYNLTYYVVEPSRIDEEITPTITPTPTVTDDGGGSSIVGVTGPTTITKPGVYRLTQDILNCDIDDGCIAIASSDVVFDGMGHTISGVGKANTIGIRVGWRIGNVTVRNVTLDGWGIPGNSGHGIAYYQVEGGLIERVDARYGGHSGIYLGETANVTIRGNSIDGAGTGIAVHWSSHGNMISSNTVRNSEWGGLELYAGAFANTFTGNTLINAQIVLSNQSHDNILHRNTVNNTRTTSSQAPINILYGAHDNLVYDNIFNATDLPAFPPGSGSNAFSVTPRAGTNILGGSTIGGNAWFRSDGSGFSEIHADGNGDGFCDQGYDLGNGNVDQYPLVRHGASVSQVPGSSGVPSDVNADSKYEDVNGNNRPDFADVVLYFNQMTWIAANEPVVAFDYNANGRIDFADVVWLFNHL